MIACRDGFRFSVIAGPGTHSLPKVEPAFDPFWLALDHPYPGPYSAVECGFWNGQQPKPRRVWRPYLHWSCRERQPFVIGHVIVYACVPVSLVYDLIRRHGGEIPAERAGRPAWSHERFARHVRNTTRQRNALMRNIRLMGWNNADR